MKVYKFVSLLGPFIDVFIKQKQACGYPYECSARILHRFDLHIADKFTNEPSLTKEMCMSWIRLKPGEHPNSLIRRISPVRQFGIYMNGIGKNAYVISGNIPKRQVKYAAHVYTYVELKAFFSSIDNCKSSQFSPIRKYVIPVFFRTLYCCGLRSSEARLLRKEDVDLETGKITIRESKGWKARVIYMSLELLSVCVEYDLILDSIMSNRQAFFPNKNGLHYNNTTINCWFHEFWDILPESREVVGNKARVHDFRHTYAVHRLNQWVKEGQDINTLYPYLSEYMGHSNYANTDYYLSLIEDFYPELEKRLSSINEDILPEVHCEEE
jgi:integrase/recombinase XerD